ncbi:MAG TPA: AAA family ATPase, partial [Chloroflexota bacterium]
MKLALVLNAINPKIGGVLIRGEKGTAKSTAVRALAHLLPEIRTTAGCPYNCHPGEPCPGDHKTARAFRRPVEIVELPVGATEDRVIGSLDISQALSEGQVRFKPGLLAAANRGILYVDEVNLLNDHLVDVLLDAAAMGRNYVEREGIS